MNTALELPEMGLSRVLPLIVAALLLNGCVAEKAINRHGTALFASNPANSNCHGPIDLELRITQDGNDDADGIICLDGSDCTDPQPASGRATVGKNQRVRWSLATGKRDQTFYLMFDDDKSPTYKDKSRGQSLSASEGGDLCLKTNGRAKEDGYRYSVYVKHCVGGDPNCRPKVLDPIIYVR